MTSFLGGPTGDDRALWDLHLSGYPLASLLAADELGVFQALSEAPSDVETLAREQSWSERGLKAVLPMLAALDLLVVREGRYAITNVTRNFLLPDSPFYWGPVLRVMRQSPPAHAAIIAGLRSGEDTAHANAWARGDVPEPMAHMIATYMHSHSLTAAFGMARAGGFEGVKRLLDVGGGSGCYSIALANAHPDLSCTVMELQSMCRLAEAYIADSGVGRIDTVAVDMFREAWPSGYDALLFSNIFHDWNFEVCRTLAARAFEALPSGGRIFLHEALLDDTRDGPLTLAAFSVQMLVSTRGQQFTLADLRGILGSAGFADVASVSTHAYYSVVSARKP